MIETGKGLMGFLRSVPDYPDCTLPRSLDFPQSLSVLQIYVALLYMDQPGELRHGVGPYGRVGLTDEERHWWDRLSEYVHGWNKGLAEADPEKFKRVDQEYWEEVRTERMRVGISKAI